MTDSTRRRPMRQLATCLLLLARGMILIAAGTVVPSANAGCTVDRDPQVTPGVQPIPPNTMLEPITPEARRKCIQDALAASPLSVREWINLMTYKVQAQPGLAWEDVIASMKQRANKINLKFVGSHPLYKEIAAITGKPSPKVEIYHFCDALLARELLDYSLEFVILMPCRIAIVEDSQHKVWLTMLDWDVRWSDAAQSRERIPDSLYQAAARLRRNLEEIIQAGASGSL
ncbi:MAG TPA: DUF302 domain-containing protein [Burkholderiaceae bacterium]|nr:DUF302 domain-containing protein [Burkholderiaceae bacterium]